jgi:cytochrome c oxidase cbb3-type subunit 3
MNDFVNQFWNWYVILLVLVSIIACGVLLWTQSSPPAGSKVDTTGHVWDETLEEYNNPLPKWWMWLFYITVIFSLVYAVLYPTLGSFPGLLGWSSSGQWAKEMAKFDEQTRPLYAKYMKTDLQGAGCRQGGQRDRQAPVPDLLHAVPWCRCTRLEGLPESCR